MTNVTRWDVPGDSVPLVLYEKAKRFGRWNPSTIELSQDIVDWECAAPAERQHLLLFVARFYSAEEAVTHELLPLVLAVARSGWIDEELFLTTFLFDEGKHTHFFARWLAEVTHQGAEVAPFVRLPAWRAVVEDELGAAMSRLVTDSSAEAIVAALMTYNFFVEGVLGQTAFHVGRRTLEGSEAFPGLRGALRWIKRDETRHVAYGLHKLETLIAADPELWAVVEERIATLLPLSLEALSESFAIGRSQMTPGGLQLEELRRYAQGRVALRYRRLRRRHGDLAATQSSA